ncbi:glutamine synthetase [Mycolicibacterium sp. CH28]|uniref:glutamine synthetase family protein n=1 Tax=Mycolicibacterium sp. CH28 TaxID=2512237 RepID=UPI001081E6AD|nr:glutamine synthetase family protein [Mycolicibacterium sp. CH28]TGD88240.1 glutamine synthetase [Mycolicibacterium sp. CH28]
MAAMTTLESDGVDTVVGTVVNPAGLTHAKTVPIRRTNAFADPGLGASPVWHGFTIDRAGIAFSDGISVVGDERIRIDLDALRGLGDGLAWAPGSFFDQDGNPIPSCARGTLARIESRLAEAGLRALVGHEIEFLLVDPEGNRLPGNLWAQYGLAGVLEHEGFVRDVTAAATAAGVGIEQFHPEYGLNQFEISLTPRPPVAAADQLILTRIIISRVARNYGTRVSLSPVPFAGSVGSGAHQHFSLLRGDIPVFSGGSGPHGLTEEGQAAIGGIVAGLPEAALIFCGSIVSGLRMQPGNWAGAYDCWGTENREAAVRYLQAGPGNPYGANVEVKVVDPSANPYFATAAILGLALDGIERNTALPQEIPVDPATLSDEQRSAAGVVALSADQGVQIAALDGSQRMRAILGDPAVNVLVAVRRYEHETYSHLDPEQLTDKFRMAWSL